MSQSDGPHADKPFYKQVIILSGEIQRGLGALISKKTYQPSYTSSDFLTIYHMALNDILRHLPKKRGLLIGDQEASLAPPYTRAQLKWLRAKTDQLEEKTTDIFLEPSIEAERGDPSNAQAIYSWFTTEISLPIILPNPKSSATRPSAVIKGKSRDPG